MIKEALAWLAKASPIQIKSEGGSEPLLIVPTDMRVESLKKYYPPQRIEQAVKLDDVQSFVDYVNRFKNENTLIFANVTERGCVLKAVIDYHGPKPVPDYCLHTATYASQETQEWRTWCAANRKPMSQVEFATWLEDNATLFAEPTGADLLELVSTLTGKSDVRFSSAVRLQSGGNKLHYDEDVELRGQVSTQGGDIELPKTLVAGISPFVGSTAYRVTARLKYKIEARKLSLWFETVAPHVIVRDSVDLLVDEVEEGTKLTPLLGSV